MTHEVVLATSGAQMSNLMRASPSVLLLATVMTIISFCQLIRHTEAGGKGKVPIYMPIPIPIPMPMGPGKTSHQNFHHHQHQHQRDDGEAEIRKIYLLQPMAHAKPQPNLKGGGFMGAPVQNNIHLGGHGHGAVLSASMSPGKHRHGGGGGFIQKTNFFDAAPELQQQQHAFQPQLMHEHARHEKYASEVKILPIVVIPPMAPMPPIQVGSQQQQQMGSHAARMTLSPQFNNYVLADSAHATGRRRSSGASATGASRGASSSSSSSSSAAEYGGSLGGSVFRERYGPRARPALRKLMRASPERITHLGEFQDSTVPASYSKLLPSARDFDYNDYNDLQDASSSATTGLNMRSSMFGARRAGASPSIIDNYYINEFREPHRPVSSAARRQRQRASGVKSIRDVIEQAGEDELSSGDDYEQVRQQARGHSTASWPSQVNLDEPGGELIAGAARSRSPASMEISMDLLSSMAGRERATATSGQHDTLSSLYYDSAADNRPMSARTSSSSQQRNSNYYKLPSRGDERDLFDEQQQQQHQHDNSYSSDEWRFDTIKSVSHAAPTNATTMTINTNNNNITTTITTNQQSSDKQLKTGAH